MASPCKSPYSLWTHWTPCFRHRKSQKNCCWPRSLPGRWADTIRETLAGNDQPGFFGHENSVEKNMRRKNLGVWPWNHEISGPWEAARLQHALLRGMTSSLGLRIRVSECRMKLYPKKSSDNLGIMIIQMSQIPIAWWIEGLETSPWYNRYI